MILPDRCIKTKQVIVALNSLLLCGLLGLTVFKNSIEANVQNTGFGFCTFGLFIGGLLSLFSSKKYKFDLVDVAVLLFNVYYVLLCCSRGLSPSSMQWMHVQLLFILYFSIRCIVLSKRFSFLIICLVLSLLCSYEALYGFLQLLGVAESHHAEFKVTGSFFNPGPLGGYLVVTGLLSLLFVIKYFSVAKVLLKRQIYNKYLFLITYLSCVISSFLFLIVLPITLSRSAIVSLFIVSLTYIRLDKCLRRKVSNFFGSKRVLKITLVILLGTLCLVGLYKIKQDSADNRWLIWTITVKASKGNWLVGNGPGAFHVSYGRAMEKFFQEPQNKDLIVRADYPDYAFNEYLQLINETGILGGFLFLIIVIPVLFVQLKSRQLLGYVLLSLLIFACTAYPLHILPMQILLVMSLSFRKWCMPVKVNKWVIYTASCGFMVYLVYCIPAYYTKVIVTREWYEQKKKAEIAFVDFRHIQDFERYYPILKDNSRFLTDYGYYLKSRKLYGLSIRILKESLKISSDHNIYILIGDNYALLGDHYDAEEYYKKAHAILPNRLGPLYALAVMYYDTNQYVKFRKIAERIVDFNPKVESKVTRYMKYDIIPVG